MMQSKIEKKNFGIAEFAEEEKWLEEQHRNGWRLIKTNRNKYHFENCDADEWIYQIDFKENGIAERDYIQIFEDCGWHYILQNNRWCYFRKKKEVDSDLSIFSDRFSKIDLYARMLKNRHLVITVILFAIACLIVYLSIFTSAFNGDSFWDGALPWIGIGLFVATSFSFNQYIKLKKMVEDLKMPWE
ncbi:DUF2812 domain-containing protein [Fusibacter bizertensis]